MAATQTQGNLTTSMEGGNMSREWEEVAHASLLLITNPHWLQFHAPSCAHHAVIAVAYTVIVIPGILGNLIMILTFLTTSLRSHKNLMSVNLAIADLLMNLEIPFLINNSWDCGPKNFSATACQVYGFTGGLSGTVAIASITGMAYQRYRKITRLFECNIMNTTSCSITLLVTWIYGLVFALFPIVYQATSYAPEGFLTSCSFDYLTKDIITRIYILAFGLAAYVVPMCLIIFFYVRIGQEVHQANQKLIALHHITQSPSPAFTTNVTTPIQHHARKCLRRSRSPDVELSTISKAETDRPASSASRITTSSEEEKLIQSKMAMEKKLWKSVVLLIACWTIAWTPYALVSLMGVLSFSSVISPLTSMIPALLAKCASVVDPYIYFFSHPRYRREAFLMMSRASKWSRTTLHLTNISLSMSRMTSLISREKLSDLRPSGNRNNC